MARSSRNPLKVVCVVGTRPEFVQVGPLLQELGKHHRPFLVHTGQHYDIEMSRSFFLELGLPKPDSNLDVGSGSHIEQTAESMLRLEPVLKKTRPDVVLVFGDTNSTLAGALAAVGNGIPVGHVEAGMRSYNRAMPEEVNRVLVDHMSTFLFCPTPNAVRNLRREGIRRNIHLVGDVMLDSIVRWKPLIAKRRTAKELGLEAGGYSVLTLHRAGNVDSPAVLLRIVRTLGSSGGPIVFPVHPRTKDRLRRLKGAAKAASSFLVLPPLGYLEFLSLVSTAKRVFTDSGGVQKQAYFFGVPCITLRDETEWVETVESGWNRLAGSSPRRIRAAIDHTPEHAPTARAFGDGHASREIVRCLESHLGDEKGRKRYQ